MQINLITCNPSFFKSTFKHGLIYKAISKKLLYINFYNPRFFLKKKDKNINDKIYGGGAGMLIKAEPLYKAIKNAKLNSNKVCIVIYMSPQGINLNKKVIINLLNYKSIIIVCGRYNGIDQRIIDKYIDIELSIGDYILSCGEISSLVLIDLLIRYIPGIINNIESCYNDSFTFNNGLLSCSNYTRPKIFKNMYVPRVLLSGNHQKIIKWRLKSSLKNTLKKKIYLIEKK